MSPWFLRLKDFAVPALFDLAVSKACKKISNVSNNQTVATIAEKSAAFLYKGPLEMVSDELSTLAEKSVDHFCDSEEETDILSFTIGKVASLGCFFLLTDGEIEGSLVSAVIGKATENLVHKSLLNAYQHHIEEQDRRANEQAEKNMEIYGYSAPGF